MIGSLRSRFSRLDSRRDATTPASNGRQSAVSVLIPRSNDPNSKANESVIRALVQQLEKNPGMDMRDLLLHKAGTYDVTRSSFASIADPSISPAEDNGLGSSDGTDRTQQWKLRSPTRVKYQIHPEIINLLKMTACTSSIVTDSFLTELNRLLERSKNLWSLGQFAVIQISEDVVAKIGKSLPFEHIPLLQFVKKHAPHVNLPTCFGVLQSGQLTCIFEARVPGTPLDTIWPRLHLVQKRSIQQQLSTMFSELRNLPMMPDADGRMTLGNGVPRRCKDMRRHVRTSDKPIETIRQFNDFLLSLPEEAQSETTQRASMIRSFLSDECPVVFTHGDLHPRNIMVSLEEYQDVDLEGPQPDIQINGILDWEFCGWYPSRWEYIKALHTVTANDACADWWQFLPITAIGSYGKEFAVDLMISRWRG